jgi:uncharacterized protein
MLLVGGLLIGAIAGADGTAQVDPLFRDLFLGALTLFLLDLGVAAALRARAVLETGPRLIVMALVVRVALPDANPGLYLTASLGITFPANLILGIPLFLALAEWAAG